MLFELKKKNNNNQNNNNNKTWKINSKVLKTKYGRTLLLSKCLIYNSKKSRFIEEQEAKGLLSGVGLKTPLSKIPMFGDIFF